MAKFSATQTTRRPAAATKSTTPTLTHEGGAGFSLDAQTELFTLAITNFVGEDTFYESADTRDDRFRKLVTAVASTPEGCDWLAAFIPWLRQEANMRTASTVAAVEYARSRHADATVSGREMISRTLSRPDEPAEAIAYHFTQHGRKLPMAVKRGVADAAVRLYNEKAAIKYNSQKHAVRPADVIELTHPSPKDEKQSALFRYLLDERHQGAAKVDADALPDLAEYKEWVARGGPLPKLATWEALSSKGKMDAKAWESVIPQMGYMALLRNLRNFEDAKVSEDVLDAVEQRLRDPEEVAKSRQLPFRFYTAYLQTSDRWTSALARALDLSLANIPEFGGRTLVLVDTSGSMGRLSASHTGYTRGRSLTPEDQACLFGVSVAKRSADCDLWAFATDARQVNPDRSAFNTMKRVAKTDTGYGTEIWPSLRKAYDGHDRVLIFTDFQAHPSNTDVNRIVPKDVPVYVWDLGGYGRSAMELGSNRYLLGGLSDQSFKTVKLLEDYKPGNWPWEA